MSYKEPPIPPPGVDQQELVEVTTDTELPSPEDIQPPLVQVEVQVDKPAEEPSVVIPKAKDNPHYPSRLQKEKLREKDDILAAKFMEIFRDLHFELSFADALIHMPKFAPMFKKLLNNKDKLIKLTKTPLNENCSAVVLKKLPEKLELADRTISKPMGVAENVFVKVGKFYFPVDFVVLDFVADPRVPLILGRPFLSTVHALIGVYEGEIILRHDDQSLTLKCGDILILEALLNNDPEPPSNQKDYFPSVRKDLKVVEPKNQSSDDVPPKVELKELPPHLDPWVSPVHCVPKKGGMTVIKNDKNELVPTRLVTGWRVCIDNRKLNEATHKDHFPLPFMDQMLERLARNEYYCFLNGFSGYFQIPIDPKDQEKTTFTCPYGTFAYKRMPFGLCNAPGTFQRCMMAIFHDMIEQTMEAFMDDFSVFGNSFSTCLTNLEKMLKRCEDTKLALNWEKSHFMVKEGIVLGHKILKKGIEVDKEKIKRVEKHFRLIHYASKTMNQAKTNYTTTEKELLAVVYASEKFRSYLIMNKNIVYTNHSALKYLFAKKDAKARLLRWILLLQEFDFKVINTKGAENYAVDHLSRLEKPYENVFDPKEINETFPLESLNKIAHQDPSTLWTCPDQIIRRCVAGKEVIDILNACHSGPTGGHYGATTQQRRFLTQAYENSLIYKERTKKLHDEKIKNCIFNVGDQVLFFNSRLKIFSGLSLEIEAFLCWKFFWFSRSSYSLIDSSLGNSYPLIYIAYPLFFRLYALIVNIEDNV
nr:DNA-directed DNA polymerase [Tanacetum cinerariifolium]